MSLSAILNSAGGDAEGDGDILVPQNSGGVPSQYWPQPIPQLPENGMGSESYVGPAVDIFGSLLYEANPQDEQEPITSTGVEASVYSDLYMAQYGVENWAATVLADAATSGPDSGLEGSSPSSGTGADVEMSIGITTDTDYETPGAEGSHQDDIVCYGMIYQADVKLLGDMAVLNTKLAPAYGSSSDSIRSFALEPRANHIRLCFPDGTDFGYLRENMTRPLEALLREPAVELEAVAMASRLLDRIGRADRPADALVQVCINIYGPEKEAARIGERLVEMKIWLQRPDYYKTQFPYKNPQYLHFPELEETMQVEQARPQPSASIPAAPGERLRQMVSEVHGSLQRAKNLGKTAGDARLLTGLLDHQERALNFMIQRESGDIEEKYRLWERASFNGQEKFIHKITQTRSQIRPEEKGGGILADEMGMGKSLSLLALMLKTLEEGHAWAEQKRKEEHSRGRIQRFTHSTLIIVPYALLINSWLDEIKIHVGDSLQVIKYHGQGRKRDIGVLENSDIVITTYNTLSSEYSAKNSHLHKIGWYRIVLDEAHVIRRPSTTFHRSCADLDARSRWCLTGTPIQNRLEDIGALFMFLRAEPFRSLAQFRRFISIPFEQGESAATTRLILLYESLCLRRTKDILTLPGQEERTRTLELTQAERDQFERTAKILARYMRQQVGEHEKQGKFSLFQARLQLQIFCNHGTYQKLFSWKKSSRNEEREAILAEMGNGAEALCAGCGQPRPILGSNRIYHDFVEGCKHILCSECLEDCGDLSAPGGVPHCPLCRRSERAFQMAAALPGVVDGDGDVAMDDGEHRPKDGEDCYFNGSGHSTKMEALVRDVKENIQTTKSIVFSCWTRTLDLVVKHFKRESIDYLRIDGKCLPSQRQRILDQFSRPSGKVRVLLMTTGTGAFGLNLTAANRVFIIEPQWNPSVENQAIARAIRLRQKEKVLVTRYVIKDTVEEEMQTQQKRKRLVARVGFDDAD